MSTTNTRIADRCQIATSLAAALGLTLGDIAYDNEISTAWHTEEPGLRLAINCDDYTLANIETGAFGNPVYIRYYACDGGTWRNAADDGGEARGLNAGPLSWDHDMCGTCGERGPFGTMQYGDSEGICDACAGIRDACAKDAEKPLYRVTSDAGDEWQVRAATPLGACSALDLDTDPATLPAGAWLRVWDTADYCCLLIEADPQTAVGTDEPQCYCCHRIATKAGATFCAACADDGDSWDPTDTDLLDRMGEAEARAWMSSADNAGDSGTCLAITEWLCDKGHLIPDDLVSEAYDELRESASVQHLREEWADKCDVEVVRGTKVGKYLPLAVASLVAEQLADLMATHCPEVDHQAHVDGHRWGDTLYPTRQSMNLAVVEFLAGKETDFNTAAEVQAEAAYCACPHCGRPEGWWMGDDEILSALLEIREREVDEG